MCPRLNGAGRSFSVGSIGLSITMAMLACRPLDFEDFYMLGEKVASQRSPVASGSFDSSYAEISVRTSPSQELSMAQGSSGNSQGTEKPTEVIKESCCMGIGVGVHAEGNGSFQNVSLEVGRYAVTGAAGGRYCK